MKRYRRHCMNMVEDPDGEYVLYCDVQKERIEELRMGVASYEAEIKSRTLQLKKLKP